MDLFNSLFDDDDDGTTLALGLTLAFILLGAEDSRLRRAARRRARRLYLTRPDLLPNPRLSTPWQALFASRNDRAFITTMGIDVDTFRFLLASGFEDCWDTTPIPRPDTDMAGAPRLGARSLDAAGGLGLYLHFLNSAMPATSLQLIFALIPTTVSRYLDFAQDILLMALRNIREAAICWPVGEDFENFSQIIQARHRLLNGAFGSMDGLKLAMEVSSDSTIENATYNGWLHTHCRCQVFAFSPAGEIMACNVNAPGSWHDSRVARPIYELLRTSTPPSYYLIADTAFPRGAQYIPGRIKAPLKAGDRVPTDPVLQESLLAFNRQLLSYRQTSEWGMRAFQGSFGRLRVPLPAADDQWCKDLLEICVRMNNVRVRCVGINQILTVYQPIWRESEDERLWDGFERMMVRDIRAGDRVSHFHFTITP